MLILNEVSHIIKEAYNEEDIAIANKTSRTAGTTAIGKDGQIRSVVARYVMNNVGKDTSILDFGAGKDAVQAKTLLNNGFTDVTAYDFGANVKDGIHDPNALSSQYELVFASNVLNVSSNEQMLRNTISDIWGAIKPGGQGVFNYPNSPRKAGFSSAEVAAIIEDEIGITPIRVAGSNATPVWKVQK